MEQALEILLGQGVLGVFLVLVIIYFRAEIKEYKNTIKELNSELRSSEKDVISFTKDLKQGLKDLFNEVRK